jgi:two-component system, response regulator PdtaR
MSPDIAVLDVMMPELDGLETAKILHTLNIPVVMVTAYSQPHIISRAENVYVSGYIVKPVSEQNLLATIRIAHARWHDMQTMRQELAETKDLLLQQKVIARAKAILADAQNISELAAHQQMIQEAMRQGMTLVDLAKKIVGPARNSRPKK